MIMIMHHHTNILAESKALSPTSCTRPPGASPARAGDGRQEAARSGRATTCDRAVTFMSMNIYLHVIYTYTYIA